MKGYLLIEDDGHEETPIGVFADPHLARDAYLQTREAWVDGNPADDEEFVESAVAFADNFARAYAQRQDVMRLGHGHVRFDVEFESGFGSEDVRIVEVEVNL